MAAGISVPVGGFAKQHIAGFNFAGVAELRKPTEPVGLRGEVLYQYFGRKKNVSGAESSNTLAFLVNAVYNVPGYEVGPYFVGGIGLYHVSDQGNNAGLNGGAAKKLLSGRAPGDPGARRLTWSGWRIGRRGRKGHRRRQRYRS